MINWLALGWVEVIGPDDSPLGWIPRDEVARTRSRIEVVEPIRAFQEDSWLIYKMRVAHDAGVLEGELNPIREAVIAALAMERAKRESEDAEARFMQMMLVNNTEMWQAYQRLRESQEEATRGPEGPVEQRTPSSPEEFAAFLEEYADEIGDAQEVEIDRPFGAAASVLDEHDWDLMGD